MRLQRLIVIAGLAAAALPALADPQIQSWQTKEGARVLFVEAHENAIVDVQLNFDAGNRRDPAGKPGLADLTLGLIDAGTAKMGEEAVRERLTDLAASLSGSADADSASLTLRVLARPEVRDPAVALVADLVAHPAFPEAVLKRERERSIDNLRQRETDPGFLAGRELTRLMYPAHPYGSGARLSADSLKRISREDLLAFWRTYYRPESAVIAIVGDLTRADAQSLAERLLAGLPKGRPAPPALADVPPTVPGQQKVIAHPASQAHVVLGLPLITRHDPDYYALMAGNYVLGGGGFDARLMRELRDKRGLTYGASSMLAPHEKAGPFEVSFSTRKDQAGEALKVARSTIADFVADGPTEAELEQAKANIVGGFPMRFDSNRKLLGYLAVIGWYRLPLTFLSDYPKKVSALTVADVRDTWRRRIDPARLATVVVGPATLAEQGAKGEPAGQSR
ncbi:M16 family metallopeptidase [Crenobacter cavernae]|uniref:Insulinase family protein n=1 Tax=Crenobacter cavernae TaxID=2290923 RepID=A0ABY0FEG1_9NEIS|nr:pitrilysin family protein [Crenobacter cavernae]RXZ44609.1 insulinase family protein [Crenobacter cavernae]